MIEDQLIPQEASIVINHGYWMGDRKVSTKRNLTTTVLAFLSHASARAGAIELKNRTREALEQDQEEPKAFESLGHLRGPKRPPEAELMTNALIKYGIPAEDIIQKGETYSTAGEVMEGVKEARENKRKIIDIALGEHLITIKLLFERLGNDVNVEFRSIEDILREDDVHKFSRDYIKRTTNADGTITEIPVHIDHEHNHTARIIEKFHKSWHYRAYKWTYEKPKRFLIKHHLVNPVSLEEKQRKARQKSDPGREWILPFDQYFSNGKLVEAPFVPTLLKIHSVFKDIKAKIHPKPEIVKPKRDVKVEVFPISPVKRPI